MTDAGDENSVHARATDADASDASITAKEEPTASTSTADHLALVARRADLLRALADGPRAKASLVETLSVSRATVERGLRELESIEAVARSEAGYRLRLTGRLLVEVHERYRRRVADTTRARRLLTALPADLDLDPAVVEGADVITAGGPSLHRPIQRQRAMIQNADHVRGFWTVVPKYARTYQEQAASHDTTISLVVHPSVLERLLTTCPDTIQRGLATDALSLREHDADLPCNLVVCEQGGDTNLGLTVHDENGVVGFLENECSSATEWATAFFERYWEAADALVPTDTSSEA